jgi:hypothetical protein
MPGALLQGTHSSRTRCRQSTRRAPGTGAGTAAAAARLVGARAHGNKAAGANNHHE